MLSLMLLLAAAKACCICERSWDRSVRMLLGSCGGFCLLALVWLSTLVAASLNVPTVDEIVGSMACIWVTTDAMVGNTLLICPFEKELQSELLLIKLIWFVICEEFCDYCWNEFMTSVNDVFEDLAVSMMAFSASW